MNTCRVYDVVYNNITLRGKETVKLYINAWYCAQDPRKNKYLSMPVSVIIIGETYFVFEGEGNHELGIKVAKKEKDDNGHWPEEWRNYSYVVEVPKNAQAVYLYKDAGTGAWKDDLRFTSVSEAIASRHFHHIPISVAVSIVRELFPELAQTNEHCG